MKEVALQLWTKVFAEILVRARVCVMLMHALRLLIRNFQRLVFRSHAFLPQSLLFLIRIILPQSYVFRTSHHVYIAVIWYRYLSNYKKDDLTKTTIDISIA